MESVTTTSETLKGIDLTRKVVERCKRVRKSEMQVKRKSADCDGQCNVWLEVFYSVADEKDECPSYTKEDFADPALCEQDIEAFRDVKGRTAVSFRERTTEMDAALIHCARIDVRPTPAFLSLDSKLHTGLDVFEFNDRMQQLLGTLARVPKEVAPADVGLPLFSGLRARCEEELEGGDRGAQQQSRVSATARVRARRPEAAEERVLVARRPPEAPRGQRRRHQPARKTSLHVLDRCAARGSALGKPERSLRLGEEAGARLHQRTARINIL